MNIIKWIGRGLLMLLASTSIALWISVTTLQMTLLNRDVVFEWLNNSGAYGHVGSSIVSLQQAPESEQNATINIGVLQQAISDTLSADFVRTVAETVLTSTYDWLQDKTDTISFSIPLDVKREELKEHFTVALEPQLQHLPACSSSMGGLSAAEDMQCLPRGSNAHALAMSMAQQAIDSSDFLSQPLTAQMLSINTDSIGWAPKVAQALPPLMIILPFIMLASAAGYIALSSDKLVGARTVAGRLFFTSSLTAAGGIAIWYFGSRLQFSDGLADAGQLAILHNVAEPIAHQAAPAVGAWLALLAGGVALVSGGVWVAMIVLNKKKQERAALQPVEAPIKEKEVPQAPQPKEKPKVGSL